MIKYLTKVFAVLQVEIEKLIRDPIDIFTRAVQPALWMLVFGEVFTRTRVIPTGGMAYLDFMTPGILAQSVLFMSIFYGLTVIWERDLGILQKFLVSPAPRTALVLGKALAAGIRGVSQAILITILAVILGVKLNWNLYGLIGGGLGIMLGAAAFSSFSLVIACLVRSRERFMGVGQLMTMPLFFASNAIYPVSMMPPWLQALSKANPLTYQVDLLRTLMLEGSKSVMGLGTDIAVLAVACFVLILIAARLYPTLGR